MANILRGGQWLTQYEKALNQKLVNIPAESGWYRIAASASHLAYGSFLIQTNGGSLVASVLSGSSGSNLSIDLVAGEPLVTDMVVVHNRSNVALYIRLGSATPLSIYINNAFPDAAFFAELVNEIPPQGFTVHKVSGVRSYKEEVTVGRLRVTGLLDTLHASCAGINADTIKNITPEKLMTVDQVAPSGKNDALVLIPFDITQSDNPLEKLDTVARNISDLSVRCKLGIVVSCSRPELLVSASQSVISRGISFFLSLGAHDVITQAVQSLIDSLPVHGLVLEGAAVDKGVVTSHAQALDLAVRKGYMVVVDATVGKNVEAVAKNAAVTIVADSKTDKKNLYGALESASGMPVQKGIRVTVDMELGELIPLARTFVLMPLKKTQFNVYENAIATRITEVISALG